MNNPLLASVEEEFPLTDVDSLKWPAGADSWSAAELRAFIGSGGVVEPAKSAASTLVPQKTVEPSETQTAHENGAEAGKRAASKTSTPALGAASRPATAGPREVESAFEDPGFSMERRALTMPVRVHIEDTSPYGHVRLESLVAFSERIRSLSLKKFAGLTLVDLKRKGLAILATEYVVEIVGRGACAMDTLKIEFKMKFLDSLPTMLYDTEMFEETGPSYMRSRSTMSLCQISEAGAYHLADAKRYEEFTQELRKWVAATCAEPQHMRLAHRCGAAGVPFKPNRHRVVTYVVRASDCDMYNVLYWGRVPSMMESCHLRDDALGFYVHLRRSVNPCDSLVVHVFEEEDTALFICLKGQECALSAFGQYRTPKPVSREAVQCASLGLPALVKFCNGGPKPKISDALDLSGI